MLSCRSQEFVRSNNAEFWVGAMAVMEACCAAAGLPGSGADAVAGEERWGGVEKGELIEGERLHVVRRHTLLQVGDRALRERQAEDRAAVVAGPEVLCARDERAQLRVAVQVEEYTVAHTHRGRVVARRREHMHPSLQRGRERYHEHLLERALPA